MMVFLWAILVDDGGDDAPKGAVLGDASWLGEFEAAAVVPEDEVLASWQGVAIDDGYVAVEDTCVTSLLSPNPKDESAGGVLDEQLIEVEILQPTVSGRIGEPRVYADALTGFVLAEGLGIAAALPALVQL